MNLRSKKSPKPSSVNNCTLCENDDNHQMQAKYMKCSCKQQWCNLKYLVRKCRNGDECHLYSSGIHADPESNKSLQDDEGRSVHTKNSKPKRRYGIIFI